MWYSDTLGVIRTPKEITINGVTHPRQIFRKWSKAQLAELGITPARVEHVDQKYYNTGAESMTLVDGETVISYATTPKAVDMLKTTMKAEVKAIAAGMLSGSDWMTHREADGGTAMPVDWKNYRVAVRAESNEKEGEIDGLADLDAIKAYSVSEGWPNDPDYVAP
jgi:hypothetical protein